VSYSVLVGRRGRTTITSDKEALLGRFPRLLAVFSIFWSLLAGLLGAYVIIQGFGSCDVLCYTVDLSPSQLATYEFTGIILMLTAILLLILATFIIDPGANRNRGVSGLATALVIFTVLWSLIAGAIGWVVFLTVLGTSCILPCSFIAGDPSPAQFEAWEIVGIIFVLTAFQLAVTATYIIDPGLEKKPRGG
jgi:hypothetical protein